MASLRIALFTPFSPSTGGGGVIFRSILPNLRGAEIQWFYLANSTCDFAGSVRLGPPVIGGPIVTDGMNSFNLFVRGSHSKIDEHVKTILAWSPDIVWVNAMNEGLLVAEKLLQAGVKHLHVSVHDDPAGLAYKSKRYCLFAPFIGRRNREVLKGADTIDVVSDAMKTYYSDRLGISSGVVYRYVKDLTLPAAETLDKSAITIGHVGSAYSRPEVFAFLKSLRSISQKDGVQFRFMNFGVSPAMTAAKKEFPEILENAGDVPEPEVIKRLQKCSFVYSMYSFNPCHRLFRETSQPTKISTYLMAARPILAHCSQGSSTIDMLSRFKLGLCVTSMEASMIEKGIRGILNFRLDTDEVSKAAEYYCGKRNLDYLNSCFGLKPI